MRRKRSDWGRSPEQVRKEMSVSRKDRQKKASVTKLYHIIRKLDKHMGNEAHLFYDKIAFQKTMAENDIQIPEIYDTLKKESNWDEFWDKVSERETFVLKPNRLSEGRGIHVITKTEDPMIWNELNGDKVSLELLKKDAVGFLRRKTTGHQAGTATNIMMAEERILSHSDYKDFILYDGIVDFRMYLLDDEVIYGKMRCPTVQSKGLGNTAKKATALFIKDGLIQDGSNLFINVSTKYNGKKMLNKKVPFWDTIEEASVKVAKIFKSPFHSVDLTINEKGEAVVMESEKIPTLAHFKKEEATRLYDLLQVWANEKLWKK